MREELIEIALKWRAGIYFLKRCIRNRKNEQDIRDIGDKINLLKLNIRSILDILVRMQKIQESI